ncbi:Ionotropic receptor 93a [Amphibalanus amphitrite]|uniref:Ionotropic receptor 93a n=1 Tax=Amphibalanus amphitrite TaxID=1232801 RepID=A0A6A4X5Z4_AMPAM|nr:Ionotropic receptor 93a [Amphibalanus amphitrite]
MTPVAPWLPPGEAADMEAVTRPLPMVKMLVVVLVLPPAVLPTSQLLTELPAEGGCRSEPLSAALAALLTLTPPSEVTIVGTDSGREAAGCLTRRLWAAGVATAHETASSEHGGGTLAVLGTARDVAAAYRRVRPPGPVHRDRLVHSPCALLASSSPGDGSVRLSAVGAVTDGRVTLSAPTPDWRLRHLGGRPLRVALTTAGAPSEPCTHDLFGYRPLPDGGAHFCGYLGETFALLAAHLRFRIEAKIIGGCGMTLANGSAYGRLAALQRGEADIGVGSCTVMYERLGVLLFEVYRPAVWALVLALAPAAAALRWLTAAAERRCRLPSRRQRWSPLLLESVALLSGQGVSARGAGAAGRTLVFFLYVVTVTLAAVYAGNLTAFLSLPRWQPPLDSLEQLADSDVQPHVVRGHSQFHMFQNQTTGARGRIWAKMTACPDCIHRSSTSTYTTSFLKRIASGEAVLFQSPRSLINRAHRLMEETGQTSERCPFHLARENLRRDFYAMMLQKNSMYTPLLDDSIRWLKQFGIVQYLYRRNVPSRCGGPATGAAVSAAPKMNLSVLRGPFFCWMAGMALACVAFFVERLSAFGRSKPTVLQGNVKWW